MSDALQEYQKARREGERALRHGHGLPVLDELVHGTCRQVPLGVLNSPANV